MEKKKVSSSTGGAEECARGFFPLLCLQIILNAETPWGLKFQTWCISYGFAPQKIALQ